MMREALIVSAVRTPIGDFGGALKPFSAVELGSAAVREAVARSGAKPSDIDQAILAVARQAGVGPNPGRQMALRAGLPYEVPAYTLNMACASSLQAVVLAAQAVKLGEAEVVVAGGAESMSHVPFLLPRWSVNGKRVGEVTMVDGMYRDGFFCPLAEQLMGRTAETLAEQYHISREAQDAFALLSHQKAVEANRAGRFQAERLVLTVPHAKQPVTVADDEHPRADSSLEQLAKLTPVFKKDGTVTAGNASGMTDGASAVVVASREWVQRHGVAPLAEVEGWAMAGVDPRVMGLGPIPATRTLLKKLQHELDDYGLIEMNEAFAAQYLAVEQELGLPKERTNVNGGAIAIGHPIGCTGARIVTTLVHEMARRNSRKGLAALCVSGGLGLAVSFRRRATEKCQ